MDEFFEGYGAFSPAEIEALGKAFDRLVAKFRITSAPDRETLAGRILEIANSGTLDPDEVEQQIRWP